jgi:hypothetical protein
MCPRAIWVRRVRSAPGRPSRARSPAPARSRQEFAASAAPSGGLRLPGRAPPGPERHGLPAGAPPCHASGRAVRPAMPGFAGPVNRAGILDRLPWPAWRMLGRRKPWQPARPLGPVIRASVVPLCENVLGGPMPPQKLKKCDSSVAARGKRASVLRRSQGANKRPGRTTPGGKTFYTPAQRLGYLYTARRNVAGF